MPIFELEYHETVDNFWTREIEAETRDQAEVLFLAVISGIEPDDMLVSNTWFKED